MTQDTNDLCKHTELRLIAAAIGHHQCKQADGTETLIPGTGKRILIGDDAYLARVAAPAALDPIAHEAAVRLSVEKQRAAEDFERRVTKLMGLTRAGHKFDWPFTDAFDDGGVAYHEAKRRLEQEPAAPAAAEQPMTGDLAGVIARGWCAPENAHKEMDSELVFAIEREVIAHLARQSQAGVQAVPEGWRLTTIAPEGHKPLTFWFDNEKDAAYAHSLFAGSTLIAAAPVAQEPMPAIAAPTDLSQQPIGFISRQTLEQLSGPDLAPDEYARLWHAENPPSRAVVPVYLAAPAIAARVVPTDEQANVLPPVAPKGPFADYSAEEVEAYALKYAAAPLGLLREILRQHDEHGELIRAEGDHPVPNPAAERIRVLLAEVQTSTPLDTPLTRAHLDLIRSCAPSEVDAATTEFFEILSVLAPTSAESTGSASVEDARDAALFRQIVDLGIQFHSEGRWDSEDEAVWADDVMLWCEGDRLNAARNAVKQAAFNRNPAATVADGEQGGAA